jgi:thioredoxin reductase
MIYPTKKERRMTDRYDAIIVGAGTAGLSAALALGRSMRRTLVLDGGAPRNAPTEHSHNLFTRDGTPPGELLRLGKKDLEKYETVEVREGVATGASGTDGEFTVTLDGEEDVSARKLLISTGVVDVMPDVPGFAEAWGRGIYHCPYCHGWEVRDRPLAVLADGPAMMHRVTLIRNLSRDLVALTDGSEISGEDREKLETLGVPLCEKKISRIEGDAGAGRLTGIVFEDGETLAREALFANPPQRQRSELAEMLGCEVEYVEMAKSYMISTDAMTQETTVKGVFAAGDAGRSMQSLPAAVASGTNAGAFMNYTLASDDVASELASVAGR